MCVGGEFLTFDILLHNESVPKLIARETFIFLQRWTMVVRKIKDNETNLNNKLQYWRNFWRKINKSGGLLIKF